MFPKDIIIICSECCKKKAYVKEDVNDIESNLEMVNVDKKKLNYLRTYKSSHIFGNGCIVVAHHYILKKMGRCKEEFKNKMSTIMQINSKEYGEVHFKRKKKT